MSSKKTTPKRTNAAKLPAEPSKQPVKPIKPAPITKQAVKPGRPIPSAKQPAEKKQPTRTVKPAGKAVSPAPAVNSSRSPKPSAQVTKPPVVSKEMPPHQYERFQLPQRIAHIFLLASFTLLALTGLPQEFALSKWAQAMIKFFGGIETTRLIHHGSAVVLMLLGIYHLVEVGYKIFVQRTSLSMLPSLKDVKDALQAFLYNLGFGKSRPQMGRYTFEEKAEYWALIWGTVIMAITGFMMWNPITTTRFLPGEIIPAAKAAHGGEALLAVLAIIVWHMYGVHIRHFNKAMWTGKQTEQEMLHDHPLELADIKAGLTRRLVDAKTLRKRKRILYPDCFGCCGSYVIRCVRFCDGGKDSHYHRTPDSFSSGNLCTSNSHPYTHTISFGYFSNSPDRSFNLE